MDKSGTRTNGSNSGSRCSNWNNVTSNSNWNIGLRAACDDEFHPRRMVKAAGADRVVLWSATPPCFGKYITRSRERRVVKNRKTDSHSMGKKHRNLIGSVSSTSNLFRAYEKASSGKRYSTGHLQFKQHLAANIRLLSDALGDGSYEPSPSSVFYVNEPKRRQISALPFSDRVVQHALCNVIEPIFDKTFLPNSYACRRGGGTHAAVIAAQAFMRHGYSWHLKIDFSKYFANIDRETLHAEIRRKVSCKATLGVIEKFVPIDGLGLPIGNLTSQLLANVYGHILDRHLTHGLGIRPWLRYMDDTVIFAHSREALAVTQQALAWFCDVRMGMKFSRWSIAPTERGLDWLGYRVWPTHKLLRRRSVVAARRKIDRYRRVGDDIALSRFVASWRGHAQWANSFNLLNRLGVAP